MTKRGAESELREQKQTEEGRSGLEGESGGGKLVGGGKGNEGRVGGGSCKQSVDKLQ